MLLQLARKALLRLPSLLKLLQQQRRQRQQQLLPTRPLHARVAVVVEVQVLEQVVVVVQTALVPPNALLLAVPAAAGVVDVVPA